MLFFFFLISLVSYNTSSYQDLVQIHTCVNNGFFAFLLSLKASPGCKSNLQLIMWPGSNDLACCAEYAIISIFRCPIVYLYPYLLQFPIESKCGQYYKLHQNGLVAKERSNSNELAYPLVRAQRFHPLLLHNNTGTKFRSILYISQLSLPLSLSAFCSAPRAHGSLCQGFSG